MNYEEFYKEYSAISEALKTQLNNQQKLLKRLNSFLEKGDLKSAAKDLVTSAEAAEDCTKTVTELRGHVESADMQEYLASGEFTRQLIEICRAEDIDIAGEENSYEIFPYRLKIDPQNTELLINGKKASGLRPQSIAVELKKGRTKLLAAAFNPAQYAAELAVAYDLALLAAAKGKPASPDADIYLTVLYKYLTPMRRFRKDYDMQSYAFDLARLYDADSNEIPDGRRFQFGPSRNNSKAIRIVDASGNEQFLATIRFYRV